MADRPHLVVIGAGPAGLAAALTAARHGVRVTLVDAAAQAGGQFYRMPAAPLGTRRPRALHHKWRSWERLSGDLDRHLATGRVRHLADHHVWCVEREATEPGPAERKATGPGPVVRGERPRSPSRAGRSGVAGGPVGAFTVHALLGPRQERGVAIRADAVLLATGGYEKVLPFPGWTLPGVLSAGGAQAMLKGGLVLPGRRVVVAGTGPLLLPVATGLAAAGARVVALVESADPRALARAPGALAARPDKLAEGARYAARLLRHRVPFLVRHTVVEAHGGDRLDGVTVAALGPDGRVVPGGARRLDCDTLAVGHGLLPHTDLAGTLGCGLDGVAVRVDDEQRTDVPGVWAAGEATGVGGADLALAEGRIAGRSAAARLTGRAPEPRSRAAAACRARAALRAFAAGLDSVCAPPAGWAERVTDETVVCRCEEVTAGTVRAAVTDLGAGDLRTVKLLTRAGMGWCQGRMCEPAVAGLTGCPATTVRRPFARPVPLGVLAGREERDNGEDSAVRTDGRAASATAADTGTGTGTGTEADRCESSKDRRQADTDRQ
ncbi:FAD-dependent oxidoreductase [Streptomyces griseoviridis]|uniref:FAD-dependent oxidoreductase n=1 Tax=Streptomyces griseoviridis TaxID=45398 RepID=A0A3Q9L0U9_STRGD|nr:NAD(P)/FAD-dependent oxidoreductase [Streptomyces griseoviridis]AZS88987.1 FAD-dependent oxidoreductase [Streptomyces griseoviridis]QCN84167.1 FAD/NAD(P)-binding oxidoreductase [Streptomyces griseoviridis]